MNKRMNRSRLNIGTYFLNDYARTEKIIKEAAECGIDFFVCMQDNREALDLFSKYNIGAVVSDKVPFWWSARQKDLPGTMYKKNPIKDYVKCAESFEDHPAIWGIDCGDEPSALDFEHYGKVIASVEQNFKNQFGYVNLYPNYAMVAENDAEKTVSQLGTATYEEYIKEYCKKVCTDYICYDFYVYAVNVARMYQNLITVSDACLKTGRSMWIVLQVNSNKEEIFLSENMLRFQAYTAMAFGAENIIWACYTAGWWHNQVLDDNGNKTEQYEKLKKVNTEIKSIAEEYMSLRRTATHFLGFDNNDTELEGVSYANNELLSTGFFNNLQASDKCVIGEMTGRNDPSKRGLFVFAAGDSQDTEEKICSVTFNAESRKIRLKATSEDTELRQIGENEYSLTLKTNSAALLII